MSTRYVWDKTVATPKYEQKKISHSAVQGTFLFDKSITVGDAYNFDDVTGSYSISGGKTYTPDDMQYGEDISISYSLGRYIKPNAAKEVESGESNLWVYELLRATDYWVLSTDSTYSNVSVMARYQAGYAPYTEYYREKTIGSGSHVVYLSGSTSSAYKSGVDSTGQYYLVYLGSDSIDPKNVSFSGTEPDSDGNMSVVVTPATNTLGGNILYQYQYSIDNGASWSEAGEKTAAMVKDIAVPPEAEQFAVRVQASDDIGFTSMTYVKTASIKVQTMRLWVGVENSARKGQKLWVGVDGAARPVVRAWVGDENGKARRWF